MYDYFSLFMNHTRIYTQIEYFPVQPLHSSKLGKAAYILLFPDYALNGI